MDEHERDHRLIKALVDWAEGGIVKRVADKIGVSPSTINRHYKAPATTRLGRDTVNKLRAAYPNFPGWEEEAVRSEVAQFGDRPFDEKYGAEPLPDIPVMGTAMGAESFDPERDIELTELVTNEVLDHVRRPRSLARDGEAYALTIVGDSMWPRFRPGRRVIVSPKAPVAIGDDVVVQLRADTQQMSGASDDPVTVVLIKELVRRSASQVELRQFNPDVTFHVDARRIARMHKVIGEVY